MIRALSTAATGLEAQQANIDRISNDLANVNTDGYKRGRHEFQDLMYQTIKEAGGQLGAGSQTPVGVQQGLGVKVGALHKIFEQGPARNTGQPFDMMIQGTGFFPVQLPNGEVAYSRTGAFHMDAQGRLVQTSGAQMIPNVQVPTNAINFTVTPSGEMRAQLPTMEEAVLGQIQLVNFQNPEGLSAMGDGLYRPTLGSGQPVQGIPGENGLGSILQAHLEGSNVNIANSMVDMISTQRAYEMGTKVMGVVDQMYGSTTNVIK